MKYLAWALILAGFVTILCEFGSCRRDYSTNASEDTGQPYLDADDTWHAFGFQNRDRTLSSR